MPVLTEKSFVPTVPLNHARIGYHDVPGTYTATSEQPDSPAVAAKSWQTFERWRPIAGTPLPPATLTKTFDSPQRIDYIGIGAASLSAADSVTFEILVNGDWQEIELDKGVDDGPTLDLNFSEQDFGIWEPVPDNEAVMLLLTPRNGCGGVRVTVEYSGDAPSIGKLAAGEVLTMHRPFYQGHSPATLAADVTRTPSVSQGGEWLGNTIIRQGRSTQMNWQNLPAPWVRRNVSPLIEHAVRLPFFVAWNPLQFRDCLYAQSEGAPQKPTNSGPRDLQSWSLDIKAYSDGSEPVTTPIVHKDYADIVTHMRASEATYRDETGTLRTAAVDEPRFDHDPVTGEALGLLVEGGATNRFLSNAAPATQDITLSSGTHTLSFYGAGEIVLSGGATGTLTGDGDERERVTLTFTADGSAVTFTVSGSPLLPQVESGSVATSVIMTGASAATRAADVVSVGEVGKWLNESRMTLIMRYKTAGGIIGGSSSLQSGCFTLNNGGAAADADFLTVFESGVTQGRIIARSGGQTSQVDIANAADVSLVVTIKEQELKIFANGVAGNVALRGESSTPTVMSLTNLRFSQRPNEITSEFKHLPYALSEAEAVEASKL